MNSQIAARLAGIKQSTRVAKDQRSARLVEIQAIDCGEDQVAPLAGVKTIKRREGLVRHVTALDKLITENL